MERVTRTLSYSDPALKERIQAKAFALRKTKPDVEVQISDTTEGFDVRLRGPKDQVAQLEFQLRTTMRGSA